MSQQSYTVLECTNPELISSGSTFVKDSDSDLLWIKNNKSHFFAWENNIENEIIELSLKFPEETFTAKWHWDHEHYDRIIYTYEYKNGNCKVLGIEPAYLFFITADIYRHYEHYEVFRNHVLEYLHRLDIVKIVNGGFELDKLNNERDEYGYESYITITSENDQFKWIAERIGISYIRISVEKKEPRIYNPVEKTDRIEVFDLAGEDGFPF